MSKRVFLFVVISGSVAIVAGIILLLNWLFG